MNESDTVKSDKIGDFTDDLLSISNGWDLMEAVNKEYREIIELFGVDVALKIHRHYRGCRIAVPKNLYKVDFVIKVAAQKDDKREREKIAVLCGYTAEWLEQKVRKYSNKQSEQGG